MRSIVRNVKREYKLSSGDCLRKLIVGWMIAVMGCFYMLPVEHRSLTSFDSVLSTLILKIGVLSVFVFIFLIIVELKIKSVRFERWILAIVSAQ